MPMARLRRLAIALGVSPVVPVGGILGKGVADVVQRLDAAAAASVIGQVAGWAWAA
jgi:hypothetical protein